MSQKTQITASVSVVPVRAEASESSEMVTQILLGETAELLDREERWYRIKMDRDGYEGWISVTQALREEELSEDWISADKSRSVFRMHSVQNPEGGVCRIPFGSVIGKSEDGGLVLPDGKYKSSPEVVAMKKKSITDTAKAYLGVSYLWGGCSEAGIDCSGFTQLVLLMHCIKIPRDASQQIKSGRLSTVENLEEAEVGSLVFFSFDGKRVVHVGFWLGDGKLLHASGKVKIELIQKRNDSVLPFNERLANHICGIRGYKRISREKESALV